MPTDRKVRVAIVGLGFGAEFIPIYQAHPDAEMYAVCRRNKAEMDKTADKYGIKARYTSYEELLKDPNVDAVHINSPIPDHGPQTIAALKAGKHVACTVPMATSKEQIKEIVELQRQVGKVYMMMETVVYSREYLFVKELHDKGELGRVQFLRGSHQQDMDGWPDYWPGLPPMWYATHCVSPCLAILSKPGKPAHADKVSCYGSGRIREDLVPKYGSPFAVETATFSVRGSDVCAEVTRSLFDTARQYRESFDCYGSKKTFEWQQVENEEPVIHTKSTAEKPLPEPEIPARVKVPDYAKLLPEPVRKFTTPQAIQDAEHLSFLQGGGHGGSHPHLAHNFL
jgi:predicted dehydrogenase